MSVRWGCARSGSPQGVVPPQVLSHADPARAVGGEGIEPGKHRAARGVGQDADLVHVLRHCAAILICVGAGHFGPPAVV